MFSKMGQSQACDTPGGCTCKTCIILCQEFAYNCNVKVYQIISFNHHVHYELWTIALQFYKDVGLCPQHFWQDEPVCMVENLFQVWFCITNLKNRNIYTKHHTDAKSNWNVCIKIFIIETWPFLSIKPFCAILLTGWTFSFCNWF